MTQIQLPVSHATPSCGGHLVTADGRTLPLRATHLVARSAGGIATVKVVMTFANPFTEVLQVRYQLPLPADAAVAGFAFVLGERRVQGQIERRAAARERFERALVEGRTAGLLEQERSSLFTQELGNLPPGTEVTAEVDVDQPLLWVDGQWEWRFPTTVAPRYLGGEGRVPDANRIEVPIADGPIEGRLSVDLHVADVLAPGGSLSSPSHRVMGEATADGSVLRIAGASLDRDVVVRWNVAALEVGVGLRVARPPASAPHAHEAYGLLTLVPPADPQAMKHLPRDVVVLLDISGSMQGQPLAAAQRVASELVGSLDERDRLELIAFASNPMPWLGAPCFATAANKAAAQQWLQSLRAGGGTEMHSAILAALQPLREDAQRQVVLVTDGLIGFESEITAAIRTRLPASSRVHVVGVGSAPNRSLTRCAARAGRGLEVIVGLDDDPAPAARRLLERTAAPLVTNLQFGGTALLGVCPEAPPDLFAGAPARLSLRLRPEGGSLTVRGVTAGGAFAHDLAVGPVAAGFGEAFLPRLVGREWVEDLEAAIAASGDPARHHELIERLGLQFAIATRATSWVAIDNQASVDPRGARRIVDVPHELAHGMSVQGLGLRATSRSIHPAMSMSFDAAAFNGASSPMEARSAAPPVGGAARGAMGAFGDMLFGKRKRAEPTKAREEVTPPEKPPHAVLRLRDATEWVFDLVGLRQWTPPARVVLVFADGREVVVEVVAERSTRAGALAGGSAVRLVLRAGALPADKPAHLRLGEHPDASVVPVA